MKLKQLSPWSSFTSLKDEIKDEIIASWLLENGPITKRIKNNGTFQLNVIQDKLSTISADDKKFINTNSEEIKKREVTLLCNDIPIVFAQTIIPVETIEKGFDGMGNLGTKPLEDILLEKGTLLKDRIGYASFGDQKSTYRRSKTK